MSIQHAESLALEPRVRSRIAEAIEYANDMERERQGWGSDAMQDVHETRASLLRGLAFLLAADRVWIDGPGLSFGGSMSGMTFGLVARRQSLPEGSVFACPAYEWTAHS